MLRQPLLCRIRAIYTLKSMLYDILITNGRVLDGIGNPWFSADIGIRDGRIAALGGLNKRKAKRDLDADGCYVTPGFIDIHSHSDLTLLILPTADNRIRQGITTEINGNCGASLASVSVQSRELLQKTHGRLAGPVSWKWQPDQHTARQSLENIVSERGDFQCIRSREYAQLNRI